MSVSLAEGRAVVEETQQCLRVIARHWIDGGHYGHHHQEHYESLEIAMDKYIGSLRLCYSPRLVA